MSTCDKCGKKTPEKSLQVREVEKQIIFLCTACDGYYSDDDLSDLVESTEEQNLLPYDSRFFPFK